MRTRGQCFLLQEMYLLAQLGVSPTSTAACTLKWRSAPGKGAFQSLIKACALTLRFFLSLLPVDNPPRWLHVPVHPVFWGADYGPLEVCVAQETSAYFLPSTCWCGLLQGWDAHRHTRIEHTVILSIFFLTLACLSSQCIAVAAWPTSLCQE